MANEEQFLKQLLFETKIKFQESPIFNEQLTLEEHWYYSICGTPIQIEKGILLGINWGAGGEHQPQTEMPDGKDILAYNFIQRSRQNLEKYLSLDFNDINFNYSNLCFFRSPHEIFLRPKDYENSLPLFKQYVDFIKPKWIFSLGNNNCKILSQFGKLTDFKEYLDSERKHKGVTAKLWDYDFFSVPHPNARVKTKSRIEIWEQIGQQFNN